MMITKTLQNYKQIILDYASTISAKTFCRFRKTTKNVKNLLPIISAPAIVINEYGGLIECNEEFYKIFSSISTKNNSKIQLTQQNSIDKICGQQFFEKSIQLIQFMQENDQLFVFKEHFFNIGEENQKLTCDIAAYHLNQNKDSDSELKSELQSAPNLYLMVINPRHGNFTCSESFSHNQRIQTLGYLSGAISHDFNNILTVISGFIEIILDRTDESDGNHEDLVQLKNSVGKATSLVERLLAFSRKQVLNFKVINIAEKFQEIDALLQRLIGTEVDLKIKLQKNLHHIEVDPVQFEQVILNLVLNAKQAIGNKSNGRIKLDISNKEIKNGALFQKGCFNPSSPNKLKSGNYVKISIIDNGCGIKRSFLHQIFDPFFSTRKKKSGTGLGLSTVFGIIRQSSGHILVNAKAKYTEFIVLFPKSDKYVELEQQITNENNESTQNNNNNNDIRILIVEDEDGIRELLSRTLKAGKYQFIMFENADDAIAHLEQSKDYGFDIIITDVVMPGTSGPEFLKYFKKHNNRVKEIMISGYGEDVLTAEFGTERNFNFLSKPFSIKNLVKKLESIVDNN